VSSRNHKAYNGLHMTLALAAPTFKRLTRAPDPRPFRFQARDLEILRTVARFGNADADQIHGQVGGSKRNVCNRLRLLFDHGFLTRPALQHVVLHAFHSLGNQPLVYGLGQRGARLLAEHGERINDKADYTLRSARVVPLQLAHTIEVTGLVMLFDAACRSAGLRLVDHQQLLDYLPAPTLASGNPLSCVLTVNVPHLRQPLDLTVIPDRIMSVVYPDDTRHSYAIEVDRGSMSVGTSRSRLIGKSTYRKKLIGYFHLWKQGLHEQRWGFKSGFRVLTVTTSETRIRSMLAAQREITGNTGHGLFLYTTRERLAALGAFGPAWTSTLADEVSLLPSQSLTRS
jgi:hypothetical protein